jgi:protein-tyrosine phosphatase
MTDGVAEVPAAGDQEARHIVFQGVVNFRDLGGYPTSDGRGTRWRQVFRSDALYRLTAEDRLGYDALGIRAVYDLRSDDERSLHPNPMASRQIALESRVPRGEFSDGSALKEASDAERRLRDVYLAVLATAGPLFGDLLSGLADPERLPAVVHCAGGKDRTGLAAALLLSWLGVDRQIVLDDYELTGRTQTPERHREILDRFVSAGMSHDAAVALLAAPRWVMAEALDVVDDEYGGVEAYLRGPAAMSVETLDALRLQLLE